MKVEERRHNTTMYGQEGESQVIISSEFHPTHCNMLAYSSSKGSIHLVDLRQSALCDSHAKLFEEHDGPGSRSFFTKIIACISNIKVGKDGRYILSRDLWDINMDSCPVATFEVHEYLRPKYECFLSGDRLCVATGSYSNLFRVFGCDPGRAEAPRVDANGNSFDFTTNLLHLACHPSENSIARAAALSLYMYYA
ncbi:Serine/threonine protein phosphatase 2A 55 kDa regulatory subunit B beta isoform [Glycine soja]|uniref:Serine/threonine protein phosphatase 2A 55 kDa regulatory subunit B beta isoform n=1 Tax=Glycine soja TaxID=3848 RepID=A0A445LPT1_GLYSO|nr:Serine/threonine protein phosphatase 2A 55 kDa regulatory subunit B beta isoform [Glycine soja]